MARLDLAVATPRAADIPWTYRSGCPVGPNSLRMLSMNYFGFDKLIHRGRLVIHESQVAKISQVFASALNARFPIRRMNPVDVYRGDDVTAMKADNTSAFNCRHVTGNPYRVSQHSYGNAIDINTLENPYVTGSRVYPAAGRPFLRRASKARGMIHSGDPIHRALMRVGYIWGARWANPDYQHFSANGG